MPRVGRTVLFADLRRAFRLSRPESRWENRRALLSSSPRLSRRGFLQASSAALLAAYAGAARPAGASGLTPRVAIVGAGIAGLNAAFVLRQAGLRAAVFEASSLIGGRIQTVSNQVAPGIYSELGGEFVDSDHEDMFALAQTFGLDLIDTQGAGEDSLQTAFYADGRLRSEDEVIAAFGPLAAQVDADYAQLSDDITYQSHSDFDARLDQTSLREYLTQYEPTDWLYKVLEAAYVNEYGLDLEDQSSLNFVQTIGTDTSDGFQVYGESDQRYKIKGGNHQIVQGLADGVAGQITLGHVLEAVRQRAGGEYVLSFQTAGGAREVRADFVILCLPFTFLRHVHLDLPLPPAKRRAIQKLGYGTNAKLILGFDSPVWRAEGFSGDSYADRPYQSGWDSARGQGSPYGAYTIYPGGTRAFEMGAGSALDQAHRLLPGLDRVFPGVQAAWRGTALRAYWPADPFLRASYAAYRPGQWTSIRGAEGETVGRLLFAGEHTSLDWQGYMNGGAESGRLAAEVLLAGL